MDEFVHGAVLHITNKILPSRVTIQELRAAPSGAFFTLPFSVVCSRPKQQQNQEQPLLVAMVRIIHWEKDGRFIGRLIAQTVYPLMVDGNYDPIAQTGTLSLSVLH